MNTKINGLFNANNLEVEKSIRPLWGFFNFINNKYLERRPEPTEDVFVPYGDFLM